MMSLFKKIILIISIFISINVLTAYIVRNYLYDHLDERKSLFYERDFSRYEFIITGDSVFCCNYSTNPDKTLWAALDHLSGRKTFPGAIDGAKPLDLIYAAEYLSKKIKPGTLVFLDSTPGRNWDNTSATNYQNRFFLLQGYTDPDSGFGRKFFNSFIIPMTSGWFRGRDLFEVGASIAGRSYYKKKVNGWRTSLEKTQKNKRLHLETEKVAAAVNKMKPSRAALLTISEIYKKNGHRLIVVLSPFNAEMARLMGDDVKQTNDNHDNLVVFLQDNHIEYLDCFSGMDSEMFVDLFHTNSDGDYFLAQKMFQYVALTNKKSNKAVTY